MPRTSEQNLQLVKTMMRLTGATFVSIGIILFAFTDYFQQQFVVSQSDIRFVAAIFVVLGIGDFLISYYIRFKKTDK